MQRCRSTDFPSCAYENISSRLNRLKNMAPHNKNSKPTSKYRHQSPANYRSALKIDESGFFTVPSSSSQVGKVAKNTGIKKYNQRVIR